MTTDIDHLLALEEKSTSGPWHRNGDGTVVCDFEDHWRQAVLSNLRCDKEGGENDAKLICELRNNARAILLELKALREEIKYFKRTNASYNDQFLKDKDEKKALREELRAARDQIENTLNDWNAGREGNAAFGTGLRLALDRIEKSGLLE